MIRRLGFAALAFLCWSASGHARDEKCLATMQDTVQACTDDCVGRARAAVDPSMKDLVIGRACAKNCLKIQMFHGRSCA